LNEQKNKAMVDAQHVDALMHRWTCGSQGCTNKMGWCYVLDMVHLKLMAQHLHTWSIAINNAMDDCPADVDTPPTSLAESLAPTKGGLKNPLRKDANKASPKDITASNPFQHPFMPPMTPSYQFYSYPQFNPYQQLPPPPPYASQTSPGMPVPVAMPPTVLNSRSSPILSDGDDSIDKLDKYFQWLTRINVIKAGALARCLQTFKEHDIVIGIIDKINDELFDKWGVSQGIRILVKSHVGKWRNAKSKGRV
jgi:hypothetical protein